MSVIGERLVTGENGRGHQAKRAGYAPLIRRGLNSIVANEGEQPGSKLRCAAGTKA